MIFSAYHVCPDSLQMQTDFLRAASSLMGRSSHPGAPLVVRAARANAILPVEVEAFQEFAGKGFGGLMTLPGEVWPRAILFGTADFMLECGLEIPDLLLSVSRQNSGKNLFGGWDGWARGVLHFLAQSTPPSTGLNASSSDTLHKYQAANVR